MKQTETESGAQLCMTWFWNLPKYQLHPPGRFFFFFFSRWSQEPSSSTFGLWSSWYCQWTLNCLSKLGSLLLPSMEKQNLVFYVQEHLFMVCRQSLRCFFLPSEVSGTEYCEWKMKPDFQIFHLRVGVAVVVSAR